MDQPCDRDGIPCYPGARIEAVLVEILAELRQLNADRAEEKQERLRVWLASGELAR